MTPEAPIRIVANHAAPTRADGVDAVSSEGIPAQLPAPATERSLRAWSRVRSWRFEPVIERVAPTYLAFRSSEHLTRYLEARATVTSNERSGG